MTQTPSPNDFLLKWRDDVLTVTLRLDAPRKGRAAFRTNIGHAKVRRREIIAETERGVTPLAKAWTDIPLPEVAPGVFSADIPLTEVGIFSGKACFFPEGSNVPEWPEGQNTHIKVESLYIKKNNSIYTVFPRQFGSFREIVRRLPLIMDKMGFRIIQTLPPFPVPTTYAVMGEYGCPFAALDFLSVDPAMAEFDEYATPLDQFLELVDAVHSKRGLFFVDLPANHTGWASTLQTHHPDWFHREKDGRFISPGAWGVKWADLVELDYTNPELRAYMADVFLFWCRQGVDGFRCDAGYMIPAETWEYIVARVRDEYPFTVFMLEGLGGRLEVTDKLLAEANLDWAYSEIFQTYDRGAFEWYLPSAIERSEKYGTLVHFAETHDNDRLAKSGETYARLRVQLAALLSWQGAWGIANGVEWFCKEKIDVHGKNDLNWGARENMVELISKLNFILDSNPLFEGASHLEVVTKGEGNTLAVVREPRCVPSAASNVNDEGADANNDGQCKALILANLDCRHVAKIDWDRAKFKAAEAFDLITERRVITTGPVRLSPGEVLCLVSRKGCSFKPQSRSYYGGVLAENGKQPTANFHWSFPRDVDREVCVPENQWVEVSAPYHFRVHLIDPVTGRTIRAYRSDDDGAIRHSVMFDAPHYKGDGTSCRRLKLAMRVYTPGRATRTESAFLIPPTSERARVKVALDFDDIRRHGDWRTILSNGAGAASQMRIGWGEIASQYDAILAANPNPNCPSDRLNIWTRTRCWLQREGYTRELDKRCTAKFTADPAGRFARWDFHVPCGMGKTAAFTFDVSLAEGVNAARLKVTRYAGGADDVGDQVRIVFRPGIEWRSFHATTKAFTGLEDLFPRSCEPFSDGFLFHPYDGSFRMTITGGSYHHEPQWSYNVSHSEEAARGQDPSGDIFSPGWISADLKQGESVSIVGIYTQTRDNVACNLRFAGDAVEDAKPVQSQAVDKLPIADAMREAMKLYIVKRDDLKTVIAGYPWFLDWGRDTFIFMRGMIAAGMIEDSVRILKAFAAFEENGTLPNIIYGDKAGNRDTTDAQLWFIRCVEEVEAKIGVAHVDEAVKSDEVEPDESAATQAIIELESQPDEAKPEPSVPEQKLIELGSLPDEAKPEVSVPAQDLIELECRSDDAEPEASVPPPDPQLATLKSLKETCRSLVDNYIKGTPNGIKVDPESGLVWSPSHFTWMDTNYPACTPRIGYPVEIQALWISALRYVGETELAEKAEASFIRYFKVRDGEGVGSPASPKAVGYYDCLSAPNGESAVDAIPEDTIRPNQLFALTLGIVDDKSILEATEELLTPGGIRSLNAGHPLYRGTYEGDEDTSRKPAYHNGTVWAWPFALWAEAAAKTGKLDAETARQMLATAVDSLNSGCIGHISEIADGDAPHAQKGCTAQAWSVSELLRVWVGL